MNFRDLPIRRKLALLILTSSSLAVILACMGFAIYERQNFRANTDNELRALADTLGANTAASLAFNDPKTAREMLGALRADHNVLGACLYDIQGNIFAEYRRARPRYRHSRCPSLRGDGAYFERNSITLFRSVLMERGQDGLDRHRVGPEWNQRQALGIRQDRQPGSLHFHACHLPDFLAPAAAGE